jgi:hypothetical protein
VDGEAGLYSGYLDAKYSIIAQMEVSAHVIVSVSWEEYGKPVTSNLTEHTVDWNLLITHKKSCCINAKGEITLLPITLGMVGLNIIKPRYLSLRYEI